MKWKYVILVLLTVIWLFIMWFTNANHAHEKATDAAVLGPPPQASKPYNILDYTKPVVKP